MNTIDYRKGMATKLIAWKDRMYDFAQKVANCGGRRKVETVGGKKL
jgi:hypothetical protein